MSSFSIDAILGSKQHLPRVTSITDASTTNSAFAPLKLPYGNVSGRLEVNPEALFPLHFGLNASLLEQFHRHQKQQQEMIFKMYQQKLAEVENVKKYSEKFDSQEFNSSTSRITSPNRYSCSPCSDTHNQGKCKLAF